jgi:hypothetical protein
VKGSGSKRGKKDKKGKNFDMFHKYLKVGNNSMSKRLGNKKGKKGKSQQKGAFLRLLSFLLPLPIHHARPTRKGATELENLGNDNV